MNSFGPDLRINLPNLSKTTTSRFQVHLDKHGDVHFPENGSFDRVETYDNMKKKSSNFEHNVEYNSLDGVREELLEILASLGEDFEIDSDGTIEDVINTILNGVNHLKKQLELQKQEEQRRLLLLTQNVEQLHRENFDLKHMQENFIPVNISTENKGKIDQLLKDKTELESRMFQKQIYQQTLEQKINETSGNLEHANNEVSQLKNKLTKLSLTSEGYQKQVDELLKDKSVMVIKQGELQTPTETSTKLLNANNQVEQLKKTCDKFRGEVETLQALLKTYQETSGKLSDSNAGYKKQVGELLVEKSVKQGELQSLLQNLNETSKKLLDANNQVKYLETKCEDLKAGAKKTEQGMEMLQKLLQTSKETSNKLTDENHLLKKTQDGLQAEIVIKNSGLDRMEKEVAAAKKISDEQIEKLKNQERLTTESSKIAQQVTARMQRLQDENIIIKSHSDELKQRVQIDTDNLREVSNKITEELTDTKTALFVTEQKLLKLQDQMSSDSNRYRQEKDTLERQHEDAIRKLRESRNEQNPEHPRPHVQKKLIETYKKTLYPDLSGELSSSNKDPVPPPWPEDYNGQITTFATNHYDDLFQILLDQPKTHQCLDIAGVILPAMSLKIESDSFKYMEEQRQRKKSFLGVLTALMNRNNSWNFTESLFPYLYKLLMKKEDTNLSELDSRLFVFDYIFSSIEQKLRTPQEKYFQFSVLCFVLITSKDFARGPDDETPDNILLRAFRCYCTIFNQAVTVQTSSSVTAQLLVELGPDVAEAHMSSFFEHIAGDVRLYIDPIFLEKETGPLFNLFANKVVSIATSTNIHSQDSFVRMILLCSVVEFTSTLCHCRRLWSSIDERQQKRERESTNNYSEVLDALTCGTFETLNQSNNAPAWIIFNSLGSDEGLWEELLGFARWPSEQISECKTYVNNQINNNSGRTKKNPDRWYTETVSDFKTAFKTDNSTYAYMKYITVQKPDFVYAQAMKMYDSTSANQVYDLQQGTDFNRVGPVAIENNRHPKHPSHKNLLQRVLDGHLYISFDDDIHVEGAGFTFMQKGFSKSFRFIIEAMNKILILLRRIDPDGIGNAIPTLFKTIRSTFSQGTGLVKGIPYELFEHPIHTPSSTHGFHINNEHLNLFGAVGDEISVQTFFSLSATQSKEQRSIAELVDIGSQILQSILQDILQAVQLLLSKTFSAHRSAEQKDLLAVRFLNTYRLIPVYGKWEAPKKTDKVRTVVDHELYSFYEGNNLNDIEKDPDHLTGPSLGPPSVIEQLSFKRVVMMLRRSEILLYSYFRLSFKETMSEADEHFEKKTEGVDKFEIDYDVLEKEHFFEHKTGVFSNLELYRSFFDSSYNTKQMRVPEPTKKT